MQLLANGRDQVAESYSNGSIVLHRLVDGTYQFGTGKTAYVVKSVKEVLKFDESIQTKVNQWLESGGYAKAIQAKKNLDLAESSKAMPGSVEALALEAGGQDLLGSLYALLKAHREGKPVTAGSHGIPPGALVPDRSVKRVYDVPDEPEYNIDDISEFMPRTLDESEVEPLPMSQKGLSQPTEPVSAPYPADILASLGALAEGMSALMEWKNKMEQQKPVRAPQRRRAPQKKAVAKQPAKPEPKAIDAE